MHTNIMREREIEREREREKESVREKHLRQATNNTQHEPTYSDTRDRRYRTPQDKELQKQ